MLTGKKTSVLLLAGGILLAVFFLVSGCKSQKTGKNTGVIPVSTVRTKTGSLAKSFTLTGKLDALESASIVPKVSGKVEKVHVDVGSCVKKGQVLVTLENQDLLERVNHASASVYQSEAALAAAQAGIKVAQVGLSSAEAGLLSAEAEISIARATFELSEKNYKRGKRLLTEGAIPRAIFEAEYEFNYKQAKERLRQAEQRYNQAKDQEERGAPAQLELAQAQARQAAASLEAGRANLALARQAYKDSFIKAPFSGVVTARNVNPGELASTVVPVIVMVNLDKMVVQADVGERFINKLNQGQEIKVMISAVSPEPFTGVITGISAEMDPQTKAFPVKIQIDNSEHLLKPGMFAKVYLPLPEEKALLIPVEAVKRDGDKNVVWVVKNGQAKKKEVKVGSSDGKQIIVLSGLATGEEIVVTGKEFLEEGAKVKVINKNSRC